MMDSLWINSPPSALWVLGLKRILYPKISTGRSKEPSLRPGFVSYCLELGASHLIALCPDAMEIITLTLRTHFVLDTSHVHVTLRTARICNTIAPIL